MTVKRFTTNGYYVYDHQKEDKWLANEVEIGYIVTVMNNLDTKAKERSKALSKLQKENQQLKKELFETMKDYILETYADNPIRRDEKLKALEKELEE